MKVQFFTHTACIAALTICAACNDSESSGPKDAGADTNTNASTDTNTDTHAGTDTGTAADEDTSDSDTAPNPFENADCDGLGQDPTKCEYEWCKKRSTYEKEWENCSGAMTEECTLYFDCYDKFFECMKAACPLGSDVPSDKSALYLCDNNFTYCTLELESK